MPSTAIGISTGLLLAVYQAVFTSLAFAFGLLGIHEKQNLNAGAGMPLHKTLLYAVN